MNDDLGKLVREIERTRVELHHKTAVLKDTANPVTQVKRSWKKHQWAWIAGGVGVAAALVWTLRRGKPRNPLVPKGYVIVEPERAKSGWLMGALKAALVVGRPLAQMWFARRDDGQPGRHSR